MKLKTYREQNHLTLEAMAELVAAKLGKPLAFQMIFRIERGQLPKPDVAKAILEATGGAVTPYDFYGLDEGRAA